MKFYLPIALFMIAAGTPLQASILVSIDPQIQPIAPGATVFASVRISGLGLDSPPSLGAFDFNLAFNPSILTFQGLTFGDPLLGDQLNFAGGPGVNGYFSPSSGVVELQEISLDSPAVLDSQQSNSFVLASLQFLALKSGTTPLTPSLNSVADSQGLPLNLGFQPAAVTVVATPEPASLLLLLTATACLTIKQRRSNDVEGRSPFPKAPG